jgi:predicted CopG family antitoxin
MNCHRYLLLYKEKLSHKSVSDKVQKEIDHYEEILDVLNITIWRKQAEIEVQRRSGELQVWIGRTV